MISRLAPLAILPLLLLAWAAGPPPAALTSCDDGTPAIETAGPPTSTPGSEGPPAVLTIAL